LQHNIIIEEYDLDRERLARGMIQVYTGNGKGKTTAALGLALRAAGHGYKTFIIQFMKGKMTSGELIMAKRLSPYLTIRPMGRKYLINLKKTDPKDIAMAHKSLRLAKRIVAAGKYDIVVLDEINVAVYYGLIKKKDVLQLLTECPPYVELILTGRNAAPEIIERADLVTEMKEIRHYYQKGIRARKGIEE
jgi:cob(I)alamin adenosyltransferase